MSEFLRSWLTAAIFVAVAVALTSGFLGLSSLLRPHRPTPQKVLAYESGVDPVGEGWSQSPSMPGSAPWEKIIALRV